MAKQLLNIGTDANQQLSVLLDDNSLVVFNLRFLPTTQVWVLDVTYGTFIRKGIRLCNHPNLLRSERRRLPFGLLCYSGDDVDPFDISDFDSGRATLVVLDNTSGNAEVDSEELAVYA